jgi:hypothetical protein
MGDAFLVQNIKQEAELILNGSTIEQAAVSSVSIKTLNPSATTGWYWLNIDGVAQQFYIDMEYDGGGWVLMLSHPRNVSLPSNVTFAQSTSDTVIGNSGFTRGSSNPRDFSIHTGLPLWRKIVQANNVGQRVVYYVATSRVALSATHSRRSSWTWTGWGTNYNWVGASGLINHVGSTTPGLWSYHISNNYNYTTFDRDNDVAPSGNCGTFYNNAPFWYGACWDGSFWGGNGSSGHANAIHWTGSGSDNYEYGAIYVR